MNEQRTTYNKIVGIREDKYGRKELVVLEDTFEHGKHFKGATGYTMEVITQREIDERRDEDNADTEMWKMAVANDQTELGLYDWWEGVIEEAEMDGELFPYDDTSYRDDTVYLYENLSNDQQALIEDHFGVMGKDYVTFTCCSCGRVFNADDKWLVVVDEDLLKEVVDFETPCED